MDKIKSLLLPLAFIFATIAAFETGIRYGATNMRAHAIAGELVFPLATLVQGKGQLDQNSMNGITAVIDNGIAAGAMHRQLWYLDKDAKAALDKVLAYAFSVRGDGVVERIAVAENKKDLDVSKRERLAKVREAITAAKADLVDNAPEPTENEVSLSEAVVAE